MGPPDCPTLISDMWDGCGLQVSRHAQSWAKEGRRGMEKFYIILRTVTGAAIRVCRGMGGRGADDLRVRENHTRKLVPPKNTLAKPSMALSIISRVEFTMRHRFIWAQLRACKWKPSPLFRGPDLSVERRNWDTVSPFPYTFAKKMKKAP